MPNISGDVTSGASTPEDFTINIDGTVNDNVTGLMWQQDVPLNQFNSFTWSDAMTFCPNFGLAGHTDWRLPTVIELTTLVNYNGGDQALGAWADPGATALWTSTPLAGTSASAWAIDFNNYNAFSDTVGMLHSVRCVR